MSQPQKMVFAELPEVERVKSCLHAWEDDVEVTVYTGNIQLAEDLDLFDGCVVVYGDLDVAGNIVGMDDEAGFLVVFGACKVRNVLIGGPEVWIERDLVASHAVLADYNHGKLTVGGDLHAQELLAEHLVKVAGTVHGTSVDLGGLRVADARFTPTVTKTKATRDCRLYFVPDVVNDQGHVSVTKMLQRLVAGERVLKF